MPHYESYDSFRTKKSIEKKNRAKEISSNKSVEDDFVVERNKENLTKCAIVIETSYKEAKVLYKNEIISVNGMQKNIPCNQLVFPGDFVLLSEDENKIVNVLERTTILSRDHKDSTRRRNIVTNKVLATNVDVAVIVVSAFSPPLHPKFIDRYLMILQNCEIEPIICLNKADLKTENDEKVLEIYRKLGILVIETSALNNEGVEDLKEVIRGKRAIFVGHSGVGKSSLSNRIMDFDEIRVGHVGEKSLRGRHTTTSSKYYEWSSNSSIIDTPGIRALDVSNFKVSEIQDYFSEFSEFAVCKYRSCDHVHVHACDCGIIKAVESGDISLSRYESYKRIVEDLSVESSKKKLNNDYSIDL